MVENKYAVQMKGIVKTFGGEAVLDNVDLNLEKGTIHALVGENGSGKTTLMSILHGLYSYDSGLIYVNGEKVEFKGPKDAMNKKIRMAHQNFMFIDKFTVEDNIMLGNEKTNAIGIINRKVEAQKIKDIINKYSFDFDLKAKVETVTLGMKQKIEIARALYEDADVFIFDEPMATLDAKETDDLIKIFKKLKAEGKTVLLSTHRLDVILKCADKCTILKDSKVVGTFDTEGMDEQDLALRMFGRTVKFELEKKPFNPQKTVFFIKNLYVTDSRKILRVKDLSLNIRKGEILGIAGFDGNGQTELVEAIAGVRKVKSGTIAVNRVHIENKSPKFIRNNKVAVMHEERLARGLISGISIADNVILEKYKSPEFSRKGIIDYKKAAAFAEVLIEQYDIQPKNCAGMTPSALSGGNQQKLFLAREIANNPDVLVVSQPTKNVDMAAIEKINSIILEQRDKGKAVLLISYDIDEILCLSDRIAVMRNGEIIGDFERKDADKKSIQLLISGGKQNASSN
ncbi:MAG: ABC transporter ATP-binding protein [Clostridia bacterium]|nr:ABC transporter ATP-binding protein [Clostridia bacterium]